MSTVPSEAMFGMQRLMLLNGQMSRTDSTATWEICQLPDPVFQKGQVNDTKDHYAF